MVIVDAVNAVIDLAGRSYTETIKNVYPKLQRQFLDLKDGTQSQQQQSLPNEANPVTLYWNNLNSLDEVVTVTNSSENRFISSENLVNNSKGNSGRVNSIVNPLQPSYQGRYSGSGLSQSHQYLQQNPASTVGQRSVTGVKYPRYSNEQLIPVPVPTPAPASSQGKECAARNLECRQCHKCFQTQFEFNRHSAESGCGYENLRVVAPDESTRFKYNGINGFENNVQANCHTHESYSYHDKNSHGNEIIVNLNVY